MPDSLWPELINPILAAVLLGARNQTQPKATAADWRRRPHRDITKVADHPG
jgi:hypothetical protein